MTRQHQSPRIYQLPQNRHPMRRRILLTLPGDGCAAVLEDLGAEVPRRYLSVLFDDGEEAERRYSVREDVARRQAQAMLDEQRRRGRLAG